MTARLRFGRYELRPEERALLVDGRQALLGARAFDVLLALVERRERVVSKSELLDLAWPGLMVEENNLSVQISTLRKVLGQHAIATIPALGYRFALSLDTELTPSVRLGIGSVQIGTDLLAKQTAALQGGPCLLVAQVAGPEGHSLDAGPAVAAHGGELQSGTPRELVASFPSAHAAAACSHRLHALARVLAEGARGAHGFALQIGVGTADRGAGDPAHLVSQLAALARLGETLVTPEVAGQIILNLDGDLQDLGEHHSAEVSHPIRAFRLTPSQPGGPSEETVQRADNLRPTVALIPFSPYTPDSAPVVLGDIIADQVISALSKSHAINVISRLSTLAFRDRDVSVQRISRRLAADFIVSGRYWVSSGRVTVHVELAEAANSRVLWTHAVVDDERAALYPDSKLILELVAGVVHAVFVHEVGSLRSTALPDLASHTLLLAAISLLYRLSPRDFSLARGALETLHERAPRHPAPLAWLARWHLFRVVQGWSDDRDEDGRQALDHANHALDLDPDSSLALTMLGNVNTNYLKDLDRAEDLYDQALAINPNESLAWLQKGNALSFAGDGQAALAHTERALSLSPLDPARHFYLSLLAGAALTARDWERTVEAARQSLKLNQEHVSPHRMLAIALAMTGRLDEARESVRRVLRLEPGLTVEGFVARSPGAKSGLALEFGRALHAAGLPLGDITLN